MDEEPETEKENIFPSELYIWNYLAIFVNQQVIIIIIIIITIIIIIEDFYSTHARVQSAVQLYE